MKLAAAPNATEISVREVLSKLDSDFASMSTAVENGEFALWVGSGISRKAPDLGKLIDRAIEYLRVRAVDHATEAEFMPALAAALKLARVEPEDAKPHFSEQFETWPMCKAIRDELWNKYSRLLDIRIKGHPADYMLWDAVDIRAAFAHPALPAAQHLCIAILILEGAVRQVASANWDGFLEAAVMRLCRARAGLLQVVVDPDQLRDAAGKARLLKFHGCIVYATDDPGAFRKYLTGSHTQIAEWPDKPALAFMRAAVTELATNLKSLVLGLSIQDANLQGVFSAAKQVHPWPWPCAPDAPGHVFCENDIKDGQRDVLKIVYGDAYNDNIDKIEAGTHLRAWAEQVLLALTLKLISDKLRRLVSLSLEAACKVSLEAELTGLLNSLRDDVAAIAVGDRTEFANRAIAMWSRMVSLFRTGGLPTDAEAYEVLSASTPDQLAGDQNAQAAGLGNLGIALSLLQHGRAASLWQLEPPRAAAPAAGAMTAMAGWAGAGSRPLFLVRGAGEAIALEKLGALASGDAIVVHADGVWQRMTGAGTSARRPRGAPGRTGRIGTRHVSIDHLLEACADAHELKTRFVAEITL